MNFSARHRLAVSLLPALIALAGCVSAPPPPPAPAPAPAAQCPPVQPQPQCPGVQPPAPPAAPPFASADWSAVEGWRGDDTAAAWPGFLASCRAIRRPDMLKAWGPVCEAARQLPAAPTGEQVRSFFEAQLQPWRVVNADASERGLITGYYEPLIRGSRVRNAQYDVPVLGVPDDLIVVDLSSLYPELKNMRLRGRLDGRRLVPYWSRAEIDGKADTLPAKPLLWTDDAVEFFFLQVQGSGQIELPDGSRERIAYADQNGHPYRSIGRWLVEKGELTVDQAGLKGIQQWARAHPQRLEELLDVNPSYVFFREEPANGEGPKGALGVPLTAGRSIAVDPRSIPLGAPVFLSFAMPDGTPMQRLMLAQDTGGAIRGRVRADFFWGFGAEAGAKAGQMRQQGSMWLLWPRGSQPPGL